MGNPCSEALPDSPASRISRFCSAGVMVAFKGDVR